MTSGNCIVISYDKKNKDAELLEDVYKRISDKAKSAEQHKRYKLAGRYYSELAETMKFVDKDIYKKSLKIAIKNYGKKLRTAKNCEKDEYEGEIALLRDKLMEFKRIYKNGVLNVNYYLSLYRKE